MRVLNVITELGFGGTQGQLTTLSIAMRHAGHEVEVINLMSGGDNANRLRAAGIRVCELCMRPGLPHPAAVWRLRSHVRRFRPEVVQSWLYHADLLALLATRALRGTALAWNIRGGDPGGTLKSRTTAISRLLARCSRMPEVVVSNSVAGRDYHARLGYRPRRWAVIPNAVDTDRYRPRADARQIVQQELGVGPEAVLIGHVARLDPLKDHEGLLHAAALVAKRHDNAHFVLVGPGVQGSNRMLSGLIGALGLERHVHLLGARSDADRLQAAWDIAVSSSYSEGFPNVLAEAMSCGVPCVSTEAGDVRDLLGDTGMVVPARDPDALASALMTLVGESASARATRGRAARERVVAHYSPAAIVNQYVNLYRSLADA